jgi:hypothetical protein
MLGIVGTVPDPEFPLVHGRPRLVGDRLRIDGRSIAVQRCTPALLAAALSASETMGGPDIYAFLVGDIGRGDGSRKLYRFLAEHLPEFDIGVLAFHYLQPDVDWHARVLFATHAMPRQPILIADAGFMYAAKMSGQSGSYDFFTPDVGELAFLADELAPHPFYTRGFVLHQDNHVPDLIRQAHAHGNAATHLLVKGATDFIAHEGRVIATVAHPCLEAMEAIGGTGDSLTGLLAALCGAGFNRIDAAVLAAQANRWAGSLAAPTPATQMVELIDKIPQALSSLLLDQPDQKRIEHGGS